MSKLEDSVFWSNTKFIAEALTPFLILALTFFTYHVYKDQLALDVYNSSPNFDVKVSYETYEYAPDDEPDFFMKVINLSEPIETEIEVSAIGYFRQFRDNKNDKNFMMYLDNYFDESLHKGAKNEGEILKIGSNYHDNLFRSSIYLSHLEQNESLEYVKVQNYADVFYLVKISYDNFKGIRADEHYFIGSYKPEHITEKEYVNLLNSSKLNVLDLSSNDTNEVKNQFSRILSQID